MNSPEFIKDLEENKGEGLKMLIKHAQEFVNHIDGEDLNSNIDSELSTSTYTQLLEICTPKNSSLFHAEGFFRSSLHYTGTVAALIKYIDDTVHNSSSFPTCNDFMIHNRTSTCYRNVRTTNKFDIQDKFGFTALHDAVYYSSLDKVKAILKSPANLDLKDKEGYTALHLAVIIATQNNKNKKNILNCIEVLIECGASLSDNTINKALSSNDENIIVEVLLGINDAKTIKEHYKELSPTMKNLFKARRESLFFNRNLYHLLYKMKEEVFPYITMGDYGQSIVSNKKIFQ